MKQDGSAHGREENRKHKLQQRFLCQRTGQRADALQHGKADRHKHAGINGLKAESLSKENKAQQEQGRVHNECEVTCRPAGCLADHGGKACYASKCKMIWKFKKVNPHYHNPDT